MNTLQLIKTRTMRRQAVERARLQMTKDFANGEHTGALPGRIVRGPGYQSR